MYLFKLIPTSPQSPVFVNICEHICCSTNFISLHRLSCNPQLCPMGTGSLHILGRADVPDLLISSWAALCLWVLLPCDLFMFIQLRKTTPKAQYNIDKDYLQWWAVLNNYNLKVIKKLIAQWVKNLPAMQETRIQSLGREDSLEKEMATHSNILAWRIPGTEEPGRLPSVGLHRVRHDWRDLAAASILAWRISWTEEPGRLQSMGLQELDTTQGLNHDHLMSEHASC